MYEAPPSLTPPIRWPRTLLLPPRRRPQEYRNLGYNLILALLQGGELGWNAAAVLLRAAYYTGSLGGAGLAFFALLFGARLDEGDARRLRRWATGASLLAIVSAIGALTAHVGVLMGGDTITDPEGWSIVLMSPAGASYALGAIGMLLVATLAFSMSWTPMAAAGGLIACASYASTGFRNVGLRPAAFISCDETAAPQWAFRPHTRSIRYAGYRRSTDN